MNLNAAELTDLEHIACTIAVEAGRLVVDERPDGLGVARTKSTDTDIVTVMDQRSEELLRRRLAELRPADGLLGEEGAAHDSRSGITWVVDPIDGTVNYLYQLPTYAVSVAACVGDVSVPGEWHPVAAAVYNPTSTELFHAHAGGGSFLRSHGREQRLSVSTRSDLAQSLVGTGFGYDPQHRRVQARVLAGLLPLVRDIRRAGSAALDLCSVAAGRLDAYYESGLHPWDLAGGQLVVTEAGGVVRGRQGAPPDEDLVVAGPTTLVHDLHGLITR
ncbi:inositol monophosphatase family protein [Leekyejoonella antrihumi]|uniref:Inositol-1-monophosphatase n=1 Tax=Leekyejoonella antrihumi TaxID=1660198 RepID=A0A563E3Q4_9MICO|nr:inositol monophosphatase family protein [Leekyejoonella antrihumi]TWP36939.1 inositol monophosphatase [Leekyejoonella antrihumi]